MISVNSLSEKAHIKRKEAHIEQESAIKSSQKKSRQPAGFFTRLTKKQNYLILASL